MKRILVIIIAIVGLSIPTMAQRLLPHQKGIEFYGGVPLQKHNTFGDGNFINRIYKQLLLNTL